MPAQTNPHTIRLPDDIYEQLTADGQDLKSVLMAAAATGATGNQPSQPAAAANPEKLRKAAKQLTQIAHRIDRIAYDLMDT
jgi:hypothetical protein